MGDINILDTSKLTIKSIDRVAPLTIAKVESIAPLATHIKEVGHIDPISVESLHVRGVKNVEPIQIERLNITNFPAMNMSLRQLPPLDMSVRRVPPLSVGLHQHFEIPSDYIMRAFFLGIEWARLRIQGHSSVIPRDRYRREVSRTMNRSFPEVAAGGNPAIPSRRIERSVVYHCPPPRPISARAANGIRQGPAHAGVMGNRLAAPGIRTGAPLGAKRMGLHTSQPAASFALGQLAGGQRAVRPGTGNVKGG
jgi:hypothetical protein